MKKISKEEEFGSENFSEEFERPGKVFSIKDFEVWLDRCIKENRFHLNVEIDIGYATGRQEALVQVRNYIKEVQDDK